MGRTGLSRKELNRVEVLGRVKAGSLRLIEAAELMRLSYRQAKRVWARYRGGGAKALQHRHCGASSNRAYAAEFRRTVLRRVRERYLDFGPTLAAEHLGADDGLVVQRQTLSRWLVEAGIWRGQRRRDRYRQRRERKPHFGELVQMDGSFHDWLEDRGGRGCLMHMVDDATSTVLCSFTAEETTWAAAGLLRRWIERYGVPRALYTDWKTVYVRAATAAELQQGLVPQTQFGRMCSGLGMRIIAASSPQAKRAGGARARDSSGPAGEEAAAGRDRRLRGGQWLPGRTLRCCAQPGLRAASGGARRLSSAAADGTATGRGFLAGAGTGGERRLGGQLPGTAAAIGEAKPAPGSGQEPSHGARERAGPVGDSLSRAALTLPRDRQPPRAGALAAAPHGPG